MSGREAAQAWLIWLGVIALALVIAMLLSVLTTMRAKAHGPAEWIERGGYKNAAGELCCGERDCFELSSSDVKVTPQGYYVISIKELIPFSEATPSPTGTYWRCQWGGSRKCFFAPPGTI